LMKISDKNEPDLFIRKHRECKGTI